MNVIVVKERRKGFGLGIVLFLIFMVLRLTDVIDWSWWWVTAPLWIPILLLAAFFVLGLIFIVATALFFDKR